MHCSPEEIEQKRRQAQMKLARRKLISEINLQNSSEVKNAPDLKLDSFKSSASDSLSKQERSHYGFQNELKSPNAFRSVNISNAKPYDKPKVIQPRANTVTGICCLITETRFAVELSGFSTPAIEVFKSIPSRSYNSKTKNWDFNIQHYDMLQQKLSLLQPDVILGKLPQFVINCCKMTKPDYSKIDLSRINSELRYALMPFQEEGACFGIDKNGRCLIADDMGLGKTFQALAIADYYRDDWPLLIVTTSSMKNTWEGTIHKYLPSVSVMHTQYMVSAKDYIGDAKILIVSYDLMSRSLDKLLQRKFGILIIDESHNLKNFKAKCTKAASELSKRAQRVILLSGTPALSRPSELYSQLAIIDDKFFGSFFDYSKRYCDGKTTHFGWDASGKSNLQELEIILLKKFMIRRTKDDVLKSLPKKTREVITLDVNLKQLSEEDKRCLNALASDYNRLKKASDRHSVLLNFFAETCKIKIPSVCSYILKVLEENKKFIVFAHHQKMLDAIQKLLNKKEKKFIRIDGNTTSEQRKYFVDKFQFNESYVCAILSITAANAGITLTAASLVIFAELHWNPSILSQAESRAHRIGQEEQVSVKYLIAPGTADDHIWPLLLDKQKTLNEIGLFRDSFQKVAVTQQDMSKERNLAEGLDFGLTKANTLDITSYFNSPDKANDKNKSSDSVFSSAFSDVKENENGSEMDLLNDDYDDLLGNVNLGV